MVFFQGDLGRHSGKGKGLNLTPSFATKALPLAIEMKLQRPETLGEKPRKFAETSWGGNKGSWHITHPNDALLPGSVAVSFP